MINSIEEFIIQIRKEYSEWKTGTFPWFRGEPESKTPLLPRVYRKKPDGSYHDENQLLQFFRMKAHSLAQGNVPPRSGHTDQWLFLAQHHGLPTRLLDWSEGALISLYFALLHNNPIVWMLNPIGLNRLSVNTHSSNKDNEYPLTWIIYDDERINIGSENIRGAWEHDIRGVNLPIAVHSTNIHPRMSAQKSCFTVHGKTKDSLNNLVGDKIIRKFILNPSKAETMQSELRMLGVSQSTIFPDLDGLSKELGIVF